MTARGQDTVKCWQVLPCNFWIQMLVLNIKISREYSHIPKVSGNIISPVKFLKDNFWSKSISVAIEISLTLILIANFFGLDSLGWISVLLLEPFPPAWGPFPPGKGSCLQWRFLLLERNSSSTGRMDLQTPTDRFYTVTHATDSCKTAPFSRSLNRTGVSWVPASMPGLSIAPPLDPIQCSAQNIPPGSAKDLEGKGCSHVSEKWTRTWETDPDLITAGSFL